MTVESFLNCCKNGDYTEGIILRSYEGRPMGDWYAQVPLTDENGNRLTEEGYYINNPEHQRVGNAQPLFVGGFINNFHYKNVFLEVTTDFSIGGKAFNFAQHYTTALGMTPSTVYMRENGIPYFWEPPANPIFMLTLSSLRSSCTGVSSSRVRHGRKSAVPVCQN